MLALFVPVVTPSSSVSCLTCWRRWQQVRLSEILDPCFHSAVSTNLKKKSNGAKSVFLLPANFSPGFRQSSVLLTFRTIWSL